ncbi:MAG: hypothetical protein ACI9CF_000998 [Candidatus Omnitrophota bacterium]|jgi:hypothetical protein
METRVEVINMVSKLGDKDGLVRREARLTLEKIGQKSTVYLLMGLRSSNYTVRWEVLKALKAIRDPLATAKLISLLDDKSFEIRWLAAEGLIQLGEGVVPSVLRELVNKHASQYFRESVHHILRVIRKKCCLSKDVVNVMHAIWSLDNGLNVKSMAKKAYDTTSGSTQLADRQEVQYA